MTDVNETYEKAERLVLSLIESAGADEIDTACFLLKLVRSRRDAVCGSVRPSRRPVAAPASQPAPVVRGKIPRWTPEENEQAVKLARETFEKGVEVTSALIAEVAKHFPERSANSVYQKLLSEGVLDELGLVARRRGKVAKEAAAVTEAVRANEPAVNRNHS